MRILFYVANRMEEHLLYMCVERHKMMEAIGRRYWFPYIKRKVSGHVQNCVKCIATGQRTS